MRQGLPLLPQEAIPKITERILRLQSLESNMVVQASLQTLRVGVAHAQHNPLAYMIETINQDLFFLAFRHDLFI